MLCCQQLEKRHVVLTTRVGQPTYSEDWSSHSECHAPLRSGRIDFFESLVLSGLQNRIIVVVVVGMFLEAVLL